MPTVSAVLLTLAAAVWVGAIVFQAAIVAPSVFVNLDDDAARGFLRTLFPRFFRLGLGCGALMAGALVWAGFVTGWTASVSTLAAITAAMLLLAGLSLWLVPRINAARDAGPAAASRFQRLHRASVVLTVLVLGLGATVLAVIATGAATEL